MSQAAKKLAAQIPEVSSKEVPKESPESGWNRRILVVDDENDILNAYSEILMPGAAASRVQSSRMAKVVPLKAEPSFAVVKAQSVDEALEQIRLSVKQNQKFAMGFFDVRLGESRDGIDLVREVLKIDPNIWVVFVTAYNDRSLESIAAELGAENRNWDYINKPFNPNEIFQKAQIFTSLWNLRREREAQSAALSDLNRRVLESERVTSVAAVARGVAHEFGNLLMQIIGKAEVSRAKSQSEMQAALDRIIEASQRASDILDRFNHLSDQKSAKATKKIESIKLIFEEALDLMNHQFKKEHIEVSFDCEKDNKAFVHSTSILQVLVNLIINATHALEGRDNKKLILQVKNVGSSLQILVKDNGPGAPPELLSKLTEPFFTTKGDRGSGLGLAICKEIIEIDHRGNFEISNPPGGGFQILISLPKEGTPNE